MQLIWEHIALSKELLFCIVHDCVSRLDCYDEMDVLLAP